MFDFNELVAQATDELSRADKRIKRLTAIYGRDDISEYALELSENLLLNGIEFHNPKEDHDAYRANRDRVDRRGT